MEYASTRQSNPKPHQSKACCAALLLQLSNHNRQEHAEQGIHIWCSAENLQIQACHRLQACQSGVDERVRCKVSCLSHQWATPSTAQWHTIYTSSHKVGASILEANMVKYELAKHKAHNITVAISFVSHGRCTGSLPSAPWPQHFPTASRSCLCLGCKLGHRLCPKVPQPTLQIS